VATTDKQMCVRLSFVHAQKPGAEILKPQRIAELDVRAIDSADKFDPDPTTRAILTAGGRG
jgi:hypothetical protein